MGPNNLIAVIPGLIFGGIYFLAIPFMNTYGLFVSGPDIVTPIGPTSTFELHIRVLEKQIEFGNRLALGLFVVLGFVAFNVQQSRKFLFSLLVFGALSVACAGYSLNLGFYAYDELAALLILNETSFVSVDHLISNQALINHVGFSCILGLCASALWTTLRLKDEHV